MRELRFRTPSGGDARRVDRVIDINIRGLFVTPQGALKPIRAAVRIIMSRSIVGERNNMPG